MTRNHLFLLASDSPSHLICQSWVDKPIPGKEKWDYNEQCTQSSTWKGFGELATMPNIKYTKKITNRKIQNGFIEGVNLSNVSCKMYTFYSRFFGFTL